VYEIMRQAEKPNRIKIQVTFASSAIRKENSRANPISDQMAGSKAKPGDDPMDNPLKLLEEEEKEKKRYPIRRHLAGKTTHCAYTQSFDQRPDTKDLELENVFAPSELAILVVSHESTKLTGQKKRSRTANKVQKRLEV